jgi:hypothetical protein
VIERLAKESGRGGMTLTVVDEDLVVPSDDESDEEDDDQIETVQAVLEKFAQRGERLARGEEVEMLDQEDEARTSAEESVATTPAEESEATTPAATQPRTTRRTIVRLAAENVSRDGMVQQPAPNVVEVVGSKNKQTKKKDQVKSTYSLRNKK